MNDLDTARECIRQINPAILSYEEWLASGMAFKAAGGSVEEFDAWSRRDAPRHRAGEPARKWKSFQGAGVGVGSLVKLCRDQGGNVTTKQDEGHELDWTATIGPATEAREDLRIVRSEWLEDLPLPAEPSGAWTGIEDLRRYLKALFGSDERVGYVVEAWQSEADGEGKRKWLPKRGVWDRTAGDLLELLASAQDLGAVLGDWNPEAGAWIRFNPLDGHGCADANVIAHRYALVESDSVSVERQHAIYQKLELPCAAIVHSGGRSLHAIVRIDAPDFKEYQKRVDFLYDVCKRNGLHIDRQNRNPSRLSRLPGATRNGKKQWLVATNTGKASWQEWHEWIAAVNDDLPDVQQLGDVWDNLPPLAETLIGGILRTGHKMLLTGPSKAGKSFLLMRLAIGIAEGVDWIGWKCRQGRVLYVNLELDPASALHRLKDLYAATGIAPANLASIDVWNLRGKAMPMTELAPKLIRRALKRRYAAIIIDPIYKVITGDENAADQMAKFCNQFDRVCAELGCAVIYCHHHSKGEQGQKRAHDRASGSGVFARDPDALLDLIELEIGDKRRTNISNRWECDAMGKVLDELATGWRDECPQDDAIVADKLARWAEANGHGDIIRASRPAAVDSARMATGWRVEGILREFPPFDAKRFFFRHPVHLPDSQDLLLDALAEGEKPPTRQREAIIDKQEAIKIRFETGMEALDTGEGVTMEAMMEYLGRQESAVRKQMRKFGYQQKHERIVPCED